MPGSQSLPVRRGYRSRRRSQSALAVAVSFSQRVKYLLSFRAGAHARDDGEGWPLTCDFYFVSLVTSQALPERRLTCDYFGSLVTSLTHEFAARLGNSASNHL